MILGWDVARVAVNTARRHDVYDAAAREALPRLQADNAHQSDSSIEAIASKRKAKAPARSRASAKPDATMSGQENEQSFAGPSTSEGTLIFRPV